jgi:asparagine synthase (glutamine-hydrolysing)
VSGLAVIYHRDGRPVDQAEIWPMLDAIPYRGVDGMWAKQFDAAALGYAKTAITLEEQEERQPLVSSESGCAIVAHVRLDNRDDLLARLPGRVGPGASDAEIILRAYECWGVDAAKHLLGDFAFVVWDPGKQRMVCARDTSGQRGLFYRVDRGTFAAASEIHQLFQDPTVPVTPNEARIRDALVPFNVFQNEKQQAETFYAGIRSVLPGHVLVVDRESVRTEQYWDLEPPAELRYRHDDEYADHFQALFSEVVRSRLRSAYPMGIMLSGGLDSTSIACVAQELYQSGRAENRGFTSFSSVFEGLDCDERPLIEDVRTKYGFAAKYVSCGSFGGRLQPEPRGFQEAPNMGVPEGRDLIFGAANRAGVRVLLQGMTADACVAGSPLVFDSLIRHGDIRGLRNHLRRYRRVSRDRLRKTVALYCLGPLLPLPFQKRLMAAYIRRAFLRNRSTLLPNWMPQPLRDELSNRHLELSLEEAGARRFSNPTREMEYSLLYPPEVARGAPSWPLELWHPFVDRRLHEFLMAVPPEQKFTPHPDTDDWYAASKRLVRQGMRGILPESVRTQTSKTVFSGVWQSEIEHQWPLYEAAFGPNSQPEVVARGYVDRERFWARLTDLRAGRYDRDFGYVMFVVGLETWLRALKLPRPQLVTVPPPWCESFSAVAHSDPAPVSAECA